MDNKEISIGLFLDLSKAFDLVDHNILLNKLCAYRIRGLALKWFRSYLTNQKQFVEIAHRSEHSNEIKNYLSSEQYIKYGGPTRIHSWTNIIFDIYKQ